MQNRKNIRQNTSKNIFDKFLYLSGIVIVVDLSAF